MHRAYITHWHGSALPECFKRDSKSQWENGKFDFPEPIVTNTVMGDYVGDLCFCAKFGQGRIGGFLPPYMQSCARKWLGYILGSDNSLLLRHLHRFWRSIRQTTSFRARMCILWAPKTNLYVLTLFSPPKTSILGNFLTGLKIHSSKSGLTLRVTRKNVLYSWSYGFGSWLLNG